VGHSFCSHDWGSFPSTLKKNETKTRDIRTENWNVEVHAMALSHQQLIINKTPQTHIYRYLDLEIEKENTK